MNSFSAFYSSDYQEELPKSKREKMLKRLARCKAQLAKLSLSRLGPSNGAFSSGACTLVRVPKKALDAKLARAKRRKVASQA